MKYDDPNLINHRERAEPSLLPSTAKARAPMQSDGSKHPLYELLRYASAMRTPCAKNPPLVLGPPLPCGMRWRLSRTAGEEESRVVLRKKNRAKPLVGL